MEEQSWQECIALEAVGVESAFLSGISSDDAMALKDIENDLRDIKTHLSWHWKVGAGVAGLFLAAFVGMITWYLPKELKGQHDTISAETKAAIGEVLAPALQKLVLSSSEIETVPIENLQARFQKTNSIVGSALLSAVPVKPMAINPLQSFVRTSLERRATMPESVRTDGLAAFIVLHAYSTFSQDWFANNLNYTFYHDRIHAGLEAIVVLPDARNHVVVMDSEIIAGYQDLDWVQWIRTTFENTKIRYHGGDVYLSEASFKNCTFEFGDDLTSQALLRRLQDFQKLQQPVTTLYAKSEPAVSKLALPD